MKEFKIESTLLIYDAYSDFSTQENDLFHAAIQARKRAYVPYSNFPVGAAILLANGQICTGNNQENAAYPSGLCAERVAIFGAAANNPDIAIDAIAISVDYKNIDFDGIVSPCGSCRQAMVEYEHRYNNKMKIYLLGRNERVYVIDSVKDILPFVFTGDVLSSMLEA